MSGPVVSNTTPLSTLARVDCLEWIPKRWGRIMIPSAVWKELEFLRDAAALERLRRAEWAGWIERVKLAHPGRVAEFLSRLDEGESETLVLANELNASLVWIDEAAGRAIAIEQGLKVTGTVGMAKWAWQQGLIPAVRPMLERLRDVGGLYLSDAFIRQVTADCGEKWE